MTASGNYSLIRAAVHDRKQVPSDLRGRSGGDWRCFPVDELTGLSLRDGPWFSGVNYDPAQSCVDAIDIAI